METATLTPEPETEVLEDPEQVQPKTIKLADFLGEWGDILKSQVIRNMNPVYSSKNEDDWDQAAREKLKQLIRPPFESQTRRGILPVARSFTRKIIRPPFWLAKWELGKPSWALQ